MTEKNIDSRIKHKYNIYRIEIKASNKKVKKIVLLFFNLAGFEPVPWRISVMCMH